MDFWFRFGVQLYLSVDQEVTEICAIGVNLGVKFIAFLLEKKRDADACRIANIVDRVRNDRHASRKNAAYELKNRKSQIQDKGDQNIFLAFHSFFPPIDYLPLSWLITAIIS